MTLTWHVHGTIRIRGAPSHFWLCDGKDIPATFSVVDPDGTAWSWAVFLPDEMRVGRAPLAQALAEALDAACIVEPERSRLLAEFADL